MADISYVWEKLHLAIHSLAASTADLNERLFNAAMSMHTLTSEDFEDAAMLEKYNEIWTAFTAIDDPQHGSIRASVNAMNDQQRQRTAELLVSLHDEVCEAYYGNA